LMTLTYYSQATLENQSRDATVGQQSINRRATV
jgi:hypothetical protein